MPEITHNAVGFTRGGVWPSGFRPMRHRIRVGAGENQFRQLADGILALDLHRRSKLHIHASPPRAAVGGLVVVGFGIGNLRLNAPCEVVWVEDPEEHDDGTRRAGFGYATLPGHPECGEESFTAVLEPDGAVYFELHAYSRHANWFYRLGAPVARFCQELVTRRYLRAARHLAAGTDSFPRQRATPRAGNAPR